jgi:hypothetical protein
VYGDPVAQSVLDVPDERMRSGRVERRIREDRITRNTQLPLRGGELVRNADRPLACSRYESLRGNVTRCGSKKARYDDAS